MAAFPGPTPLQYELWIPTADLPYPHPHGIKLNDAGTTAWVVTFDDTDGALLKIDVATKAVTVVETGLVEARASIEVDASGRVYFMAGDQFGMSTLYRHDPSSGITSSITSGTHNFGFTLSRTLSLLFIINAAGAGVYTTDLSGTIVDIPFYTITGASGFPRAFAIALNEDDSEFLIVAGAADDAAVVDAISGAELAAPSIVAQQVGRSVRDANGALLTNMPPTVHTSNVPGSIIWFNFDTRTTTGIGVSGAPSGGGSGMWTGIDYADPYLYLCHGGVQRFSIDGMALLGADDYGIVRMGVGAAWHVGYVGQ